MDCQTHPTACISEELYRSSADALVAGGFADAGYTGVHVDDCWASKQRDPMTGRMVPDPARFPSGMAALGNYLVAKNLSFGLYTDQGTATCGGYPGSEGHEAVDAATFAEWGVQYLKVDGCNAVPGAPGTQYPCCPSMPCFAEYARGYAAMGAAIRAAAYGNFRLNFHRFDRFELDLRGHTQP